LENNMSAQKNFHKIYQAMMIRTIKIFIKCTTYAYG
jgi:hypothetical protein